MKYNFKKFLDDSESKCRTKSEFVKMINEEMALTGNVNIGSDSRDRYLYLKRLDNAKFCAEKAAIKEEDIYNSNIISLLDKLS